MVVNCCVSVDYYGTETKVSACPVVFYQPGNPGGTDWHTCFSAGTDVNINKAQSDLGHRSPLIPQWINVPEPVRADKYVCFHFCTALWNETRVFSFTSLVDILPYNIFRNVQLYDHNSSKWNLQCQSFFWGGLISDIRHYNNNYIMTIIALWQSQRNSLKVRQS